MGNYKKLEQEENPLVSICMITYNHEKYIQQAVDSILMQKMNFSYELLIADDASTDSTQQILKDKYSNKKNVKLILREKNSEGKNGYLTRMEAKGKYIYFCEGDDYCVGEDSLQTLVEWLENHKRFVGVCGRRITLSERTGYMFRSYDKETDNKQIELDDFLKRRILFDMTAILYRNFYEDGMYDYRSYLACPGVGDVTGMLYILLHGEVYQLNKIVGIYRADRIAGASAYNSTNTTQKIFEDHIGIISKLPNLIHKKLDYMELKKMYTMWYVNAYVSTYEILKQIPYLLKKVGIRVTFNCVKERIKIIRESC